MPITSCLWQQSERHIYPPLGRICVTDVCLCVCVCVCSWVSKFKMFLQIGGRCVRASERGVCCVVIVCGNCLISLTSASNPLTPTKQSNNYYMTHTQTQTWIHTSTPIQQPQLTLPLRSNSSVRHNHTQCNPCCSQTTCMSHTSHHFDL